jgi:ATP-binding cassette, subfamily C, bacterial CydD
MRARRSSAATVEQRLLAFEPRVRPRLWLATAFGTASAVCVLAAAVALTSAVAQVFLGGADLAAVLPLLGVATILAVVRAACMLLQEIAAQRASSGLRGALRSALTGHLLGLGPAHTSGERSGELVTAMTGGLDDIDLYVTSYQPARRLAAIVPLLVLLVVLLLDPPTALVLVLTGPVLVLLLAVIGGRTRVVSGRRAIELRWLGAFFLDMLQGLATLRMFGRGREQVETIRAVSKQYGDTTMDVLRTAFQTALVLEWGAAVATAVVAVEVSLRLIDGQMAFERALAVLVITPEFFLPLRQLAIRYHSGSAGRAAAERVFQILDAPLPGRRVATSPIAPAALPPPAVPLGDIRFEGVWFSYDGRSPALRDLDLVIPRGEVVALVGVTGAGKTTCSSLLLRFIEPERGRITVGGIPLETFDRATWLRSVAWVPQKPHLFHGSVAQNIRLARPEASDADVRAAAEAANAAGFIRALPRGFDTPIGEAGSRLSGGQRQRLAIARAWLKDAPVLILDEATSQLDAASEAAIGAAMVDLVRGRTVLVISHRMRLTARADRVLTLADGQVVS